MYTEMKAKLWTRRDLGIFGLTAISSAALGRTLWGRFESTFGLYMSWKKADGTLELDGTDGAKLTVHGRGVFQLNPTGYKLYLACDGRNSGWDLVTILEQAGATRLQAKDDTVYFLRHLRIQKLVSIA